MKRFYWALLPLVILLLASSCVGKKKYAQLQRKNEELRVKASSDLDNCQKEVQKLKNDLADMAGRMSSRETEWKGKEEELIKNRDRINTLNQELEYLRKTNTSLLDRMSDLSVISKEGAESIKKSLTAIDDQNKYIKDLNKSINRKDSVNMSLVMNIKRSLANINDEDVTVEVKKGVVYVSLSDKMLFKSGSYVINQRAEEVLGKIALIVNDHRDLDILVEGHTDNVPISTGCLKDNWDLSVMRSTAVVRLLQNRFGVSPDRMTAGGRSEYISKADNNSTEGRQINRRTEIIILPKLDQFFKLAEPSGRR